MFDAARVALLASGAPVEAEIARTHGGLIAAFSLHLVRSRRGQDGDPSAYRR